MSKVVGEVTPEEQAIIDERDRYQAELFAAETDEERDRLVEKINDATARFDAALRRRRAAGEWS